jgi:hypothetical protein
MSLREPPTAIYYTSFYGGAGGYVDAAQTCDRNRARQQAEQSGE